MTDFARLWRSELHRLAARRITTVLIAAYAGLITLLTLISYTQHSKDGADGQFGDVIIDPRWEATDTLESAQAVGAMGALLVFILGASAGGAEWSARTVQALLFWEPRRMRVIAAKVAALAVVVLLIGVLGQLLMLAGSWFLAVTRGTTDGYTADVWNELAQTAGRGIALMAFAAVAAFAVSSLTRNTAAALGAGFGYLVIAEPLLMVWRQGLTRYLLTPNVAAWLDGRFEGNGVVLGSGGAGLMLCAYLVILVGAATALFVRRDVT